MPDKKSIINIPQDISKKMIDSTKKQHEEIKLLINSGKLKL